MKEFLVESALPFLGVCAAISGLTALLFDIPASPPARPSAAASSVAPAAALLPVSRAKEEQVSEVLSRAMRNLDAARTPREPPALVAPGATSGTPRPSTAGPVASGSVLPLPVADETPALPGGASGLFTAVSALREAVQAVREVRTEEDLTRAEERMRGARQQMEAACKSGASPLCQSAEEMRKLGY